MKKKELKKASNNIEIAAIFFQMADILELKNVKWKPQAYIIAGQTLESLKEDVSEIYQRKGREGLMRLSGIGEALADKIIEYLNKRSIKEHEKLRKKIPPGIYEMMQIPGIGAKKASIFYNKLGIKTPDELLRAVEEHRLKRLSGFKERAEEKIKEGIEIFKARKPRMPLKTAEKIANKVIKKLKRFSEVQEAIAAGSIRRKKDSIGDIDIIIKTNKPRQVLKKFVKMNFVREILGIGDEKATIVTKDNIQIDARVFTNQEFGAGLLYFTGDKQHNIWLRKIAIKKGLKLNEYGLFNMKTGKRIAGKNEAEIYEILGLRFLPPERRIGSIL
jgi:DNA polymerase (family 10)